MVGTLVAAYCVALSPIDSWCTGKRWVILRLVSFQQFSGPFLRSTRMRLFAHMNIMNFLRCEARVDNPASNISYRNWTRGASSMIENRRARGWTRFSTMAERLVNEKAGNFHKTKMLTKHDGGESHRASSHAPRLIISAESRRALRFCQLIS